MAHDPLTSLVDELHVGEDLARIALQEACGDLEGARQILIGLLPRLLVVKARFIAAKPDGGGGLIFVLARKGLERFHIFRTVYDDDKNWIRHINVRVSPESFYQLCTDYFKSNAGSSKLFDSQKLKDGISRILTPRAVEYLFDLWNVPKSDFETGSDPLETFAQPAPFLHTLIESALSDALLDRAEIEVDYDFLTEAQFATKVEHFGLLSSQPSTLDLPILGTAEQVDPVGLNVRLKGRFAIDPVEGRLVSELRPGDIAYTEILDRDDIAVSIARLTGAYKKGLWLPVRGIVTDSRSTRAEGQRFRIRIAAGVYVDVLSYGDIRVRTVPVYIPDRMTLQMDSNFPNMLPLLVGAVLLAAFIMILIALR